MHASQVSRFVAFVYSLGGVRSAGGKKPARLVREARRWRRHRQIFATGAVGAVKTFRREPRRGLALMRSSPYGFNKSHAAAYCAARRITLSWIKVLARLSLRRAHDVEMDRHRQAARARRRWGIPSTLFCSQRTRCHAGRHLFEPVFGRSRCSTGLGAIKVITGQGRDRGAIVKRAKGRQKRVAPVPKPVRLLCRASGPAAASTRASSMHCQ